MWLLQLCGRSSTWPHFPSLPRLAQKEESKRATVFLCGVSVLDVPWCCAHTPAPYQKATVGLGRFHLVFLVW